MTPPAANDDTVSTNTVSLPAREETETTPDDQKAVSSEFMNSDNEESRTETETDGSDDMKPADATDSSSEEIVAPKEDPEDPMSPTEDVASDEYGTSPEEDGHLVSNPKDDDTGSLKEDSPEIWTELKDENEEEDKTLVDAEVTTISPEDGTPSPPMVEAEIVSGTDDSSNGGVIQAQMVDEEEIRQRAVENIASATAEEVKEDDSNLKNTRRRAIWALSVCIIIGVMIALIVTLRDNDDGNTNGDAANQQSGFAQDFTSNPSVSPTSSSPTSTASSSPTFLSFELVEEGSLNGRLEDDRLNNADVRTGGLFGKDLEVVNIGDESSYLASQTTKTSMLAIMYGERQDYAFNRRLRARRDGAIRAVFNFVAFFFCDAVDCEQGSFIEGDYGDEQFYDDMALAGDGSKVALAREGLLEVYDLQGLGLNLTKKENIRIEDSDILDAPLGRIKGIAMNKDGSVLASLGNELLIYNTDELIDGFCEKPIETPPVIGPPPPLPPGLSPPSLPGNGCRRRRKLFIPPPLPGGDDDDDDDCSDPPTTVDPCVRHLRELFLPPPLPPNVDPCTRFRRELNDRARKLSDNLVPCTYYPLRFSWQPSDEERFDDNAALAMDNTFLVVGSNKLAPFGVADGFKLRVMDVDGQPRGQIIEQNGQFAIMSEHSLALSANGSILAVGYASYPSLPLESSLPLVGRVDVYKFIEDTWVKMGSTLFGSSDTTEESAGEGGYFGYSVSLSEDGNTLGIGAPGYSDADNGEEAGRAVTFKFGEDWTQQGDDLFGSGGSRFGSSLSITKDGRSMLVGAPESRFYGENTGEAFLFDVQSF